MKKHTLIAKFVFISLSFATIFCASASPAEAYDQQNPQATVQALAFALIEGDEQTVTALFPERARNTPSIYEFFDLMSDVEKRNLLIEKNPDAENAYLIKNNVTGVEKDRLGKRKNGKKDKGKDLIDERWINVALARIGKKYVVKSINSGSKSEIPVLMFDLADADDEDHNPGVAINKLVEITQNARNPSAQTSTSASTKNFGRFTALIPAGWFLEKLADGSDIIFHPDRKRGVTITVKHYRTGITP